MPDPPSLFSWHLVLPGLGLLLAGPRPGYGQERDLRPIAEMQQQLVRAQVALEKDYEVQREHDARFHVLLGHVAEAMAFVSVATGQIIELNEAAAALMGRPREALAGRPFAAEVGGRERAALMHEQITDLHAEMIDTRALLVSVLALIFLPLTYLTGLYGMNVPLPGQSDPFAFDVIVGVSVAFLGGGMLYFVKARWFR